MSHVLSESVYRCIFVFNAVGIF